MDKKDRDPLRSVRRASGLLRLLSMRPVAGWRLTDLAQASGLHHATVHRLLAGLGDEQLVTRTPGSLRYTLGPLAFELGLAARHRFAVPAPVEERLAALAQQTRTIVFLAVRSGDDSVCIGRWEGRKAPKAYTVEVGTRRALSLSAGGVAILVTLAAREREAIVRRNVQDIALRNDARVAAVRRMVVRSLRLGYGCNDEDIIPGITALGVAFGGGAGAVSLATNAADLPGPPRESMVRMLRGAAEDVAAGLAATAYSPAPTAPPKSPAAGRRTA